MYCASRAVYYADQQMHIYIYIYIHIYIYYIRLSEEIYTVTVVFKV
jgi:hypothetical protein